MSRRLRTCAVALAATAALVVMSTVNASSAVLRAAATTADVVCSKWAATSGDDGNPGTQAAPYRSLGKLVATLQAGQTGCLPAGQTYYAPGDGNGVVGAGHGTGAAPVTITSGPGGTATVKGQLWLKPESHDIVIENLNLHGTYGPDGKPFQTKTTFLILHGDRITVRDNDITNGRGICIGAGKAHASDQLPNDQAANLVVTRNRIHGCGMDGDITWNQGDSGAHGVYLENTLNADISHNLIYLNRYRGLQLWPRNNSAHIHHNVFDQNATHVNIGSSEPCAPTNSCRAAAVGFRAENTKVYDNILTHRVTDWRPSQNPSQLYGYFLANSPTYGNEVYDNCFAPNDPAMTGDGYAQHDNQIVQASFVDRAARDYRLLSNSHCLGKGPSYIQPNDNPPVTNTAQPAISGAPQVGSTLTTSGGTWNPAGVTKSYQWLRNGAEITGATADSYTLVPADEGETIRVRVIAARSGYTSAMATSDPVGPVTGAPSPDVYRPDGLVKKAGTTSYLGGGIYNRTGVSQTLLDTVRRGERRTYWFRVENDGNRPDLYYFVGTGAGQGYTTRYFAGSTDITSDVVSGNYGTPVLMPGASRTFKVVVKATTAVTPGTIRLWYLHAVSGHDPAPLGSDVRDTVRLRLRSP